MQKRLIILLFIFGLGLCGVGGFYYWLGQQVPKADPNFIKEQAEPDENAAKGQMVAPAM